MLIVAYFSSSGEPQTGLTPTIRVRRLDTDALVVTDEEMTESGDGFYKYDFTDYVSTNDYSVRADGGNTLSDSDRYKAATDENKSDAILAGERFDKASAKIDDNVLTVYDDTGDIQAWDLTDRSGAPASTNVYNRIAQ